MIRIASRSIAKNGEGEDRIKVNQFDASTLSAVLADGAGGTSGGAKAADLIVNSLSESFPSDIGALFDQVLELDRALKFDPSAGLSTVVSVYINGADFFGTVIGDSDALLIERGGVRNLAPQKEIKPLVGDGEAFPTMFSGSLHNAVLLLCSDGLSKYISVTDVLDICVRLNEPVSIVNSLIDAIELPEGELQDDVSVIVLMNS